jgi:hypothetical protein
VRNASGPPGVPIRWGIKSPEPSKGEDMQWNIPGGGTPAKNKEGRASYTPLDLPSRAPEAAGPNDYCIVIPAHEKGRSPALPTTAPKSRQLLCISV